MSYAFITLFFAIVTLATLRRSYNLGKRRGYAYGYDVAIRKGDETNRMLAAQLRNQSLSRRTPKEGDSFYVINYDDQPITVTLAKITKVSKYLHTTTVEYQYETNGPILTGSVYNDTVIIPDSCQTC